MSIIINHVYYKTLVIIRFISCYQCLLYILFLNETQLSEDYCKANVYVCPSKNNSPESMDYENCRLMCYKVGDEKLCNNLKADELIAKNYSWVMTNDVTRCCFEVSSDQKDKSKKVNIGITNCTDCDSNKRCNLGQRWNYWHLDFNIKYIQSISTVKRVQAGMPLNCSIDCDSNNSSFGCYEQP